MWYENCKSRVLMQTWLLIAVELYFVMPASSFLLAIITFSRGQGGKQVTKLFIKHKKAWQSHSFCKGNKKAKR